MKRYLSLALTLALLPFFPNQKAEAITITYSETTKKVAPFIYLNGGYDLPFNLNLSGSLGFAPDLSSFIVPLTASDNAGSGDLASQISSLIGYDTLLDLNANLGYNIRLLQTGVLSTTVTPFLGYRHMLTFTGRLNDDSKTINTQAQGLNYGAKLSMGLPLGFSGYGYAGATTLMGGSFQQGTSMQTLNPNGTTLPDFGAGLAWNLPFVNLASVYAGYRGFFLPNDLRRSANFTSGTTLINGFTVGFNVLFFGV